MLNTVSPDDINVQMNDSSSDEYQLARGTLDDECEDLDQILATHELLSRLEKCYCGSKKKINSYDVQMLRTLYLLKTLEQCYHISGANFSDKKDFDTTNMEGQLEETIDVVRQSMKTFSEFKGDYFAVHDPIVNKNLLTFKATRLAVYSQRQREVLEQLEFQG